MLTVALSLAHNSWHAWIGTRFFGKLDDIRVYNRALTENEIKDMISLPTAPNIYLTTKNISFGDVDIGNNYVKDFFIRNDGDTTLSITSISTLSDVFNIQLGESEISGQDSQKVNVTFRPDSLLQEQANIIIQSNDPDNATEIVNVSGYGVDRILPQINAYDYSVEIDEPIDITATITDNYALNAHQVLYRTGNSSSFQTLDMTNVSDNNYEATIPASAVLFFNVEFYIKAEDFSGNITYSDTIQPQIQFPNGYLTS